MINRMDIIELWCEYGFNVIEPPAIHLSLTDEGLDELNEAIKKYGTQGEITLPNEDKYEEFKKWFMEVDELPTKTDLREYYPFPSSPVCGVYNDIKLNREKVFEDFEKELEEKEKKEKIRDIVSHRTRRSINCIDAEMIYKDLIREGIIK